MNAEIRWYETQWSRKFYGKRDGLKQHYGGRSRGQIIISALEPNIYLTRCCCCIRRLNNDWDVFIALGNYLIQILCGPLALICRAIIHIICQYQSAPFHYPWQFYAITHFKSLQPLWTRFWHIWNPVNAQVPFPAFVTLTDLHQGISFLQSSLNIRSN